MRDRAKLAGVAGSTEAPVQSRVSILMPMFNAERYIRSAATSILDQTFRDLELVVVDDGSSDRSAEFVGAIRDPRIRLLQNPRRLGVSAARNQALAQARGTYVGFMDSDDVARPDRIARQVDFLTAHNDVALVGSWAGLIDSGGRLIGSIEVPCDADTIFSLLPRHNCFVASSVMVRRTCMERLGGFRTEMSVAEDYDFFLRASEHFPLANIGTTLLSYRVHPSQLTTSRTAKVRRCADAARADAIRRRLARGWTVRPDDYPVTGFTARLMACERTVGHDLLKQAQIYLRAGDLNTSRRLALAAIAHSPLSASGYRLLFAGRPHSTLIESRSSSPQDGSEDLTNQ
jgi:glycosyltransferase involved in cell wall biosynthesis